MKSQITPFRPPFDSVREKGRNNVRILPRNKYRRADRTIRHVPYLTSKEYGSSRKSNRDPPKDIVASFIILVDFKTPALLRTRVLPQVRRKSRKRIVSYVPTSNGKSDSPWFPQTDSPFLIGFSKRNVSVELQTPRDALRWEIQIRNVIP